MKFLIDHQLPAAPPPIPFPDLQKGLEIRRGMIG